MNIVEIAQQQFGFLMAALGFGFGSIFWLLLFWIIFRRR